MTNPTRFFESPIGPIRSNRGLLHLAAGLASAWLVLSGGALQAQGKDDLTKLSVDDLMNVEVTSVARKAQKLSDTPAAVFVITQDDIRRSGATTIPEVLRMVPGLEVARINGNIWAVSARGFNNRFANKMLVLMDGRSVYSTLFSGVFWDVQDTMLEDIDRIEVIRGPGGTLWGANAVNGIINIITKHSIDTQGTLISAEAGVQGRSSAALRHGGSFARNGTYRAYAKTFNGPASIGETGLRGADGSNAGRAGFRADWGTSKGDTFTAQGDIYRGSSAQMVTLADLGNPFAAARFDRDHFAGGNLLFRWSESQSSRSDTTLQIYYDQASRAFVPLRDMRRTLDFDFLHHMKLGKHDLVWGVEYRALHGLTTSPSGVFRFDGVSAHDAMSSAFVQDEFRLTDRLHLTAGSKVLYNEASGLQLQPTVRMVLKATPRHTLWAAATSAVRTPSIFELNVREDVGVFPGAGGKPVFVEIVGDPALRPERVNSYEAGSRWLPAPSLSVDATAFHNDLKRLHGVSTARPRVDSDGRTILPIVQDDTVTGHENGAELLITYASVKDWNLALGYSFVRVVAVDATGPSSGLKVNDAQGPEHQLQFRSMMKLSSVVELNTTVYYVDRLVVDRVPAYLRFDMRLAWRPVPACELSIAGQNLFHAFHTEFVEASIPGAATPVRRTVYGKVTWRF